ncbi:MAG: S-methyl-5'-thioadenosine phosphorylase [SAR202 cluster bacterium]|nr:S-methyl-5'-thioadenosine phosphorylase [SAR202 cluster bacterium]
MKKQPGPEIAVLGGSGLYQFKGLVQPRTIEVRTPYGSPSDSIVIGELAGKAVAFLPRHGRGHRLMPSEVPARANIWALKSLGVKRILAVSAVGSLREQIRPLEFITPDQLIDRTRGRVSTFFGDGIVAHIGFADPVCAALRERVAGALERAGARVHAAGTYVVMEGPAFSTRAESNLYRSIGASVIGMTALPEAKLAREAEMCYAVMGAVTDYDCWHPVEEAVSVEAVVANLGRNVETARRAILEFLQGEPPGSCDCANALKGAIITSPDRIPAQRRKELALLIGKYLS